MEKRTFKRHIINLSGKCSAPEVASHPVEIRDFCPGGMLLSFEQPDQSEKTPAAIPSQGDIVEISCAVPTASGEKNLQFRGRIVRSSAASAGFVFIEPDFDALHILYNYAKDHPVNLDPREAYATSAPQAGDSKLGGKAALTLLPACKEIASGYIATIAKEFLEKVDTRLFDVVGTVSGIHEKNAYYDAMNIFKKHGDVFTREFEVQMQACFNNDPQQSKSAEPSFKEMTLSLVEDAALEDWLAFSDISRNLETEYQETLSQLEQRLSVVFQTAIDKENNPFGPAAFSQAFQNALNEFTLDRLALKISYAIYKDVLTGTLGELYDKLNQHLIEEGVLPELAQRNYKIRVATKKPAPAARAPVEDTAERPKAAEAEAPTGETAPVTNPIKTEKSVSTLGAATQQQAPQADNPAVPSSPPAGVVQDWYQLVQNLGNFQQYASQLAAQLPAGAAMPAQPALSAAPAGAPATPSPVSQPPQQPAQPTQFYSAEEMLQALSHIKLTADAQPGGKSVRQGIQSQMLAELANVSDSDRPKMIPARSAKALEVAENLFDSVLEDKLVASNVRPWLQQLSVPLFKMAIRDDSVFYDKSHAARQLLDRISQLELYGEEGSDKGMHAIRNRVNTLLGEIASAVDVTPELFGKVLKEVNMLIRLQNRAYDENVNDLAVACEAEEKQLKTVGGAPVSSINMEAASKDPEFQEWKKKIKRLKIGDWLLLDVKATPQRLRLAWIAKNHDRYVFVNVKGLKEATLTRDELAQQLRSGTAVVLDDGGEPLIDRAQYAMLQKMHSQLLHETTHDHLTGLVNRREFERHIAEALCSARQLGLHHTLYILNLNQFSLVNSTFGYDNGDRLLVEITQLLRQELDEHSILARIGGNEFGMLLENSLTEEAQVTAARHREAIQNYRFTLNDKSLSISFSAALIPIAADSENVAALLQVAEASCSIARDKGTNHILIYQADDPELSRHMQGVKWVTKIDEALDKQSLVLRHQPIVKINAEGTSVHHSEVLLGVPDENGKLIPPMDFVLAAEHYRRMPAVDRWVIEKAFHWMVEHDEQLARIGGLAINLSGASLNEEGLIEYILDKAQKLNVPMDKVCFEVTETAGVTNLSNASNFILALKKTGCMFSLDDFGSGMSSYAYLKNLPVDFLKIDGAFVKKMDENPYDYAVVKSITEVGHFMGKKIIAEFVENERILDMLREIGVDYAQGYVIAKPSSLMKAGILPKV